ncbi:MAG: hypothetical protein US42_C0004G0003 [Candidatus Magasanikbacteria bacterium GW2011_GWC2_37_14]|uniref:Uncharacterized protein n=1 Tax=Candidatus Magasanikbacteria bacterium GW2011_GWC2_37_14 TaxID=1619046 RepID=A0A0G0IUM7_9BACT|nr:MAG: hypothetical protein US42_C0004G0003 [Candidatus Magasanikbacteria bacterium GW2011_GWC2_37_14]
MENNNLENVEKKVMSEIKTGRIKLKSKYLFLVEKLGLSSILVFSIFLAVLFFSLFFYYLKTTDNLWYLSFGSRGFFAFLESFPYLLIALFIILILIAGLVIKTKGWLYKKPFSQVGLILLGVIVLLGVVLSLTNVWEFAERRSFGPGGSHFFRPFFEPGLGIRGSGIAGLVVMVDDKTISIQTPHGEVKLDLSMAIDKPENILPGNFVMAIGERNGDLFVVERIRIVEEGTMPMIRRGVERRFNSERLPVNFREDCGHLDCFLK